MSRPVIERAELVLACPDLDASVAFYTGRLGLGIELVSPADDPAVVVVAGSGLRLRLERGPARASVTLRATGEGPETLVAPEGTRVEVVAPPPPYVMPPLEPAFVVTRRQGGEHWVTGRAGMQYRDLVPGRQGGRYVGSQIRIPRGGPVPDYVHYHRVRFQMIFCTSGWVRLVYEDQGEPFVMRAGDCVLQPPGIRHRVLECSDGLEVVELSSPALHDTCTDPGLTLPTGRSRPERDFGGQRFVFHQAERATWEHASGGLESQDLGFARATADLATARVLRLGAARAVPERRPHDELTFLFVLAGTLTLDRPGQPGERLEAGDAAALPAGEAYALVGTSRDAQLLEVRVAAPAG